MRSSNAKYVSQLNDRIQSILLLTPVTVKEVANSCTILVLRNGFKLKSIPSSKVAVLPTNGSKCLLFIKFFL
jgi:hypothetical protein